MRIRVVHETDKAYGAPRITAELNDGAPVDERVNHKRVARVMADHAIAGIRLRRRVRTTIPEPSDEKLPDLLKWDLTVPTRNRPRHRARPGRRRLEHRHPRPRRDRRQGSRPRLRRTQRRPSIRPRLRRHRRGLRRHRPELSGRLRAPHRRAGQQRRHHLPDPLPRRHRHRMGPDPRRQRPRRLQHHPPGHPRHGRTRLRPRRVPLLGLRRTRRRRLRWSRLLRRQSRPTRVRPRPRTRSRPPPHHRQLRRTRTHRHRHHRRSPRTRPQNGPVAVKVLMATMGAVLSV